MRPASLWSLLSPSSSLRAPWLNVSLPVPLADEHTEDESSRQSLGRRYPRGRARMGVSPRKSELKARRLDKHPLDPGGTPLVYTSHSQGAESHSNIAVTLEKEMLTCFCLCIDDSSRWPRCPGSQPSRSSCEPPPALPSPICPNTNTVYRGMSTKWLKIARSVVPLQSVVVVHRHEIMIHILQEARE